MPCLISFIALFFPRVVLALIFFFTTWFYSAFETPQWPFLGFLFMPYTTLAYMGAMLKNHHSVSGGWLVLVIVAALIDLGHGQLARRTRRRRR